MEISKYGDPVRERLKSTWKNFTGEEHSMRLKALLCCARKAEAIAFKTFKVVFYKQEDYAV